MKRPIAVKKLTTPMAIPFVSVGRMIEHTGNFRLRNGHGSGMIRFVWNSSPPNGGEFRSGNVTDTLVTGSTAVSGGAFPAYQKRGALLLRNLHQLRPQRLRPRVRLR